MAARLKIRLAAAFALFDGTDRAKAFMPGAAVGDKAP